MHRRKQWMNSGRKEQYSKQDDPVRRRHLAQLEKNCWIWSCIQNQMIDRYIGQRTRKQKRPQNLNRKIRLNLCRTGQTIFFFNALFDKQEKEKRKQERREEKRREEIQCCLDDDKLKMIKIMFSCAACNESKDDWIKNGYLNMTCFTHVVIEKWPLTSLPVKAV